MKMSVLQAQDWYQNLEQISKEGAFAWKGGEQKCTEGIWVLSKPIVFNTPEHGKVNTQYITFIFWRFIVALILQ